MDPAVAEAIRRAQSSVKAAPNSAAAWGTLGMVLDVHDLPDAARRVFARAEVLDPADPRWCYFRGSLLATSRPDLATVALRRAADACDASSAANMLPRLRLAELLLGRQQVAAAQDEFERVLRAEPPNTRAKVGLARCLMNSGDLTGAVQAARDAASDPRTHKAAEALLAQLYARQGDLAQAQAASGAADDASPDVSWPDPFSQQAADLATGRTARLDVASRELDAHHGSDALARLRAVVKDYPDDGYAWLLLGRAYIFQSDRDDAEQALKTAERLQPDSVSVQFHLGVMYRASNETDKAAVCFRRVVAAQPEFPAAQFDLGQCLAREKDRTGAAAAFREAIRYNPSSSRAYSELGRLLADGGPTERPDAIANLKRAVALSPADADARTRLEQISGEK
jgi:tetratricopeptide (TPR) repeat protein